MATAAARATLPRPLLSLPPFLLPPHPPCVSPSLAPPSIAVGNTRRRPCAPRHMLLQAVVPVSAVEGLVPVMLKKKPID
ncbi:hypothetical protein ZEAMMB73_Zm00001d006898 [Zea mays]|uniref:Uncharacterized protein n=1 Tax=Zea mays TaxID=4577 RepID=A0A1D6F1W5_MAIZE|nr:hypothetical protein ZEAMMB73_Zm00001d006898 [Zea mays]